MSENKRDALQQTHVLLRSSHVELGVTERGGGGLGQFRSEGARGGSGQVYERGE